MVRIEVDATEVIERKTDKRGRVRIGPEYADKDVAVAVVDVSDEDEDAAEQVAD